VVEALDAVDVLGVKRRNNHGKSTLRWSDLEGKSYGVEWNGF